MSNKRLGPVTAAMLYDLVQCPHRVTMDIFGDPAKRDNVSPFVQLLWDRGTTFEQQVIGQLQQPFLSLLIYSGAEKERLTREAMDRREPLIYGGRISVDDLLGDPDLLRLEGGRYVAGDIKSGSGEESGSGDDDDGKPKVHYAVQLALYTDVLSRLGLSAGRRAFVWDVHGREVTYDFDESFKIKKPTTLWHKYVDALAEARTTISQTQNTLPAFSSVCKNCVWYSACVGALEKADDLTLIPFLGRSKRDVMYDHVATVTDFAASKPDAYINKKKTDFPGIGPDSLRKFHARANLISTKGSQTIPIRACLIACVRPRTIFSTSKWIQCGTFVTCTASSSDGMATMIPNALSTSWQKRLTLSRRSELFEKPGNTCKHRHPQPSITTQNMSKRFTENSEQNTQAFAPPIKLNSCSTRPVR